MIHWTAWKEAVNAWANVGKPALAMLVSSEGLNMESERPASAHRTDGIRAPWSPWASPIQPSLSCSRIIFFQQPDILCCRTFSLQPTLDICAREQLLIVAFLVLPTDFLLAD